MDSKGPTLVRGLNDKHWQITYLEDAPTATAIQSGFLLNGVPCEPGVYNLSNGDIIEPLPGQTLVVR